MESRWQAEMKKLKRAQVVKEDLEKLKQAQLAAERDGDLNRAAELKFGRIPELERELEALSESEEEDEQRLLHEEVKDEDIAGIVARWTGIPVSRMLESEVDKLLRMEENLARRVIGQSSALTAVSHAIRRSRSGLGEPNRPIGSFLFMGPTGVGKTETARALAEFLFDDDQAMVRIDMSEYMEKHSVSRLIGAPPGYVGYDEGGQLTEAVRRRPYSVVLLDEVEKAHSDVFNILLQVLDDGRLTDSQGRTVDFRNVVVMMTSNVGSDAIQQFAGRDEEKMREMAQAALREQFRPEFINRIDDIVIFHALTHAEIDRILDLQLVILGKRLESRGLSLELTDAGREALLAEGFDPMFGARPLKRAVQNHVQNNMATALLAGMFYPGDTVVVDFVDGEFTCSKSDASTQPDPMVH
jgi:ATP-dependent Clp protease ATP-binding subunit ClpB